MVKRKQRDGDDEGESSSKSHQQLVREAADEDEGAPKIHADFFKGEKKRLIVVLERASLETVKTGDSFQLLNCDDHKNMLQKAKRDVSAMRPDITHQCLLMLLDSPLNKAGLLQIYIHTEKNVLIEVHPTIRIPRTFKRFSGLMVQLLHKLKIRAVNQPQYLLKVIRNPIESHLPSIAQKFGTAQEGKLVECGAWAQALPADKPVVVVIGALSHGDVPATYAQETISISQYPLSAAVTCSKFCSAFERKWGVL